MKDKFIPGIYNYCDRWCERCAFTSRCRNYENTSQLKPEQLDMNNKAFWNNLSSNFDKALKLLQKAAKKHGIDINKPMSPEEEQAYEERESVLRKATKQHPLSNLCAGYRKVVLPFFKDELSSELVDKTRELVSHLHMGIHTEEGVAHTMAGLGDCEAIIRWYVFFIDAKLQRALHGKIEGEGWELDNGYPKDSDGSAKIAVIAVEKSMAAWTRMYELLPSCEDAALKALSLLTQIKRKALEEFPACMAFKRPGFDE